MLGELRRALGLAEAEVVPDIASLGRWGGLVPGRPVACPAPLFPRIEAKVPACAEVPAPVKPKPAKPEKAPEGVALIGIEDFARVKLATATVLQAEKVEGSDRLLKLQIEVGAEKRQIVSGIAKWYAPEALVGRMVVVVANLRPATLFGVESQGMLLAAKAGSKLVLVTVDGEIVSGASVG